MLGLILLEVSVFVGNKWLKHLSPKRSNQSTCTIMTFTVWKEVSNLSKIFTIVGHRKKKQKKSTLIIPPKLRIHYPIWLFTSSNIICTQIFFITSSSCGKVLPNLTKKLLFMLRFLIFSWNCCQHQKLNTFFIKSQKWLTSKAKFILESKYSTN